MRRPSLLRNTATLVAVTLLALLLPAQLAATPANAIDAQVTVPTTAPPPPPTAAQEALRASYQAFLGGLENAVNAAKANPAIAKNLSFGNSDPIASLATAHQLVSQLTSTQLDELRTGLSTAPSWQQMATKLSTSVAAFKAAPAINPKAGGSFTNDCASAGSAPDGFEAAYIANQVQSALQAVMIAAPGVIALFFFDIPDPVKIVLAIAWGIANAIYLALSQVSAVSLDCAATAFGNTQSQTFPVNPTNPSVVVAGSSEISILNLIAAANGTQTEITNVQNTVKAIGLQSVTLTTNLAVLNATLVDINNRVTETQDDLKVLKTNLDVLLNTERIVLGKSDAEIVNLNTFQTLQLRMDIEENLTRNGAGTGPIALFALPATPGGGGGYLDMAKTIVVDTITKETAVGRGNPKAASDLATANEAYANKQWKTAYNYYSKAYQDVR